MAETKKNWYVLRVVNGKEARLKEHTEAEVKHNTLLQQHVPQVLIPMEKPTTLCNGKRVEREEISPPGYIFAEVSLMGDVVHILRLMPNCSDFPRGLDNSSSVSQSEASRILGEAENIEIMSGIEAPYETDEVVKVADRPFSGFSGVIGEVNAGKHKLKALVEIFGRRALLELSFMQVEKEA